MLAKISWDYLQDKQQICKGAMPSGDADPQKVNDTGTQESWSIPARNQKGNTLRCSAWNFLGVLPLLLNSQSSLPEVCSLTAGLTGRGSGTQTPDSKRLMACQCRNKP